MGLGLGIGIWWSVGSSANPTTNHIITENEDSLMTESGDNIVT